MTNPDLPLIAALFDRPGSTHDIVDDMCGGLEVFIADIGTELAGQPEDQRPGSVTVLVLADGHENSIAEWTKDAVQKVIRQQGADYNWDFVFVGANIDAVGVGSSLGFAPGKSLTYAADRRRARGGS